MIAKKRKLSLFWSYFLSYLALVVVLLFVVAAFTQRIYGQFNAQIIHDNSLNTLSRISMQNEDYIETMQNIATDITVSADISSFRFEEAPERVLPLVNLLWQYRINANFIYQMYLKFNEDHFLYSSTSSYRLDVLLKNLHYESLTPSALSDLLTQDTDSVKFLPVQRVDGILGTKTKLATFILPFGYKYINMGGVLMFLISDQVYQDMMRQEIDTTQDIFILQNGSVIVRQNGAALADEQVLAAVAGMEPGEQYRNTEMEGIKYNVFRISGVSFGLEYVLISPADIMKNELQLSLATFWLFMLLLSLVSVGIITLLALRNASPIARTLRLISPNKSAGNELSQLQQGVTDLVAENQDLNRKLVMAMPGSRAEAARRFVSGSFETREEANAIMERIGVEKDMQYFAVVVVAYSHQGTRLINLRTIERLLMTNAKGAVSNTVQGGTIFALFFFSDYQAFVESIKARLQQIRDVHPMLTMAISNPHEDIHDGPAAYLEAMHAFDGRFIRGNNELLRFDAVQNRGEAENDKQYPTHIINRLRRSLHENDLEGMYATLDNLRDYFAKMNISLYMFRSIYNEITNVLINENTRRSTQDVNEQISNIFSLSECLSLEEMDQLLRELCRNLISKKTIKPGEIEENEAIERIVEQMRLQYNDPNLSISHFARQSGMSDVRFSIEFKEKLQMTPKDYLTQLRMKQARVLLRETDLNINEIALKIGYLNTSSFIRRFKLYIGMTPLQYRKNTKE